MQLKPRSASWYISLYMLSALAAPVVLAEDPDYSDGPALGLIAPGGVAGELSEDALAEGRRFSVRLTARWAEIETQRGRYDWSAYADEVSRLGRAGVRVVVCLTGSHPLHVPGGGPPSPTVGDSFEAWLGFVRSAARTLGGDVALFEIWDGVGHGGAFDPTTYAFVLKSSALAVRAEAEALGVSVGVAQGALRAGSLDWQEQLWELDGAAYIDVLPLALDATAGLSPAIAELDATRAAVLAHPPAAPVWVYAGGGADAWDRAGLAVATLAAGASAALVDLDGVADAGALSRWSSGAHQTLAAYAPAPTGTLRIENEAGQPTEGGAIFGRFFSDADFSSLIFYADDRDDAGERTQLFVDSGQLRNSRVIDPLTGQQRRVPNSAAPGGRRVAVLPGPQPQALSFQKPAAPPGFELPPEAVETSKSRELTAREIIARYQKNEQAQTDALDRWTAGGRTDLHFKLAQGGSTIDVTIFNNYFWERGGHLEWEETHYLINGNRVGWKKFPELPLIQPEKVMTRPLSVTLDKTYEYRRVGRDRVDGRDAYVLEFRPAEAVAGESLFRGRVWIDVERFVRLKLNVVQTNLEAPVLSNEETTLYIELEAGGKTFWLPLSIDGQQIWKAAGQNFVVRREAFFEDIQVNPQPSEFAQRRAEAYQSENQMLRDTDKGMRYLEREGDGSRSVKWEQDSSQLFAGGGAFKDRSTDGVTPLGGVNYFNYDLWDKNIQVNAFFAGVIGFFTASDPDLFGSKVDGTLSSTLVGIKFDDEIFLGDRELVFERIRQRNQNMSFSLGVPAGPFWKFNFGAGLTYRQYFDDSDAQRLLDDFNALPGNTQSLRFVLPEDHLESRGSVGIEFNRRGYTVAGSGTVASRSDWEEWGLFDDASGSFVTFDPVSETYVDSDPAELQDGYTRWGVTVFKEWYLPKFQKLRGEVNYLDGSDLDRFSRYQFSLFGDDRLNGFSGSGVRFDQGYIARAGYSFNLFEALRFDAVIESAQVEETASGLGTQSHTGFGLSSNFVGPWKTVISFSWGHAVASDVPDLEGENEYLFLVFKLF